jgi:pimeloyl-ACP methyl ester carboxylesterase
LGKALLKYLRNLAIAALSLYVLSCVLMYAFQDKLLFHPQPKSISETSAFIEAHPDFDTMCVVMEDNTRISVFLSKHNSTTARQPLVIYFGGNAEEVSDLAEYGHHFKHRVMALVNNRGFGRSGGRPSENSMFSDALEVYDRLCKRPGVNREKVIIIGRSIGTGVATYLSAKRPVKATILITPYESMVAVAQEKYPILPIGLLIRHPFKSEKYAEGITTPVLAFIAKNDVVIPPPHAYSLLKHWKGKTSFLELNADHHSIMDEDILWKRAEEFIDENLK